MQVVERRLEQAAEESRKAGRSAKGWQGLPDARVRLSCLCIVIPAMREWLVKPLDSGLRRNDVGGKNAGYAGTGR